MVLSSDITSVFDLWARRGTTQQLNTAGVNTLVPRYVLRYIGDTNMLVPWYAPTYIEIITCW